MTRNIYYHGKIKAAEYYVREFLHGLIEENNKNLMRHTMLGRFLSAYDKYSNEVIKLNEASKIKKKKIKFINKAFKYYSKITDDDVWYLIKQYSNSNKNKKCYKIAKRLMTRKLPLLYPLDPSRINKINLIIKECKNKIKKDNRWMVYVDILDFVSYKTDKEPIYIKENNASQNILNASKILDLLSDKGEASYFLYLDSRLSSTISKKLLKKLKEEYCLLYPEKKFR